jgi:superfamily I DNA/RNA helicase
MGTFKRLKLAGYSASDMVFLFPSHELGKQAVEIFNYHNIAVNHVFDDSSGSKSRTHKKSFWMGDGRLKVCTIHSFKGWELVNVILYIPPHAPESNKKLDSLIYTALTRTKENLIVLNANQRYREFGSKLPKKWDEQ